MGIIATNVSMVEKIAITGVGIATSAAIISKFNKDEFPELSFPSEGFQMNDYNEAIDKHEDRIAHLDDIIEGGQR